MNFNLVILGDSGVGKTSFIRRISTDEFSSDYNPTTVLQSYNCRITVGNNNIHIYDGSIPSTVDMAIIMFDLCNNDSFLHVMEHYGTLLSLLRSSTPIVICGNKTDKRGRTIYSGIIRQFLRTCKHLNLPYLEISARTCYNCDKPCLFLLRKIIHPKLSSKQLR